MAESPGSIEVITRAPRTGGYHPSVMGQQLGIAVDGRPRFTWLEAERMRLDPQIQFGLRILRAPLFGATFKVQADSPQLQAWVNREFGRIYRAMLPRLARFYEYGIAAGELTFKAKRSKSTGATRIHFNEFLEFHPRDVRPLVFDRGHRAGKLAGMHVSGVRGGSLYLDRRHGFFFKGEAEYGQWWGRPRMAGPYEPWVEKRGRGGAVPSRQLFYKKGAHAGPRIRYPIGFTDMGSPETGRMLVSNQDIARELVEKFENGGVLALPNVKIDGAYAWEWEDPKTFADVAGLLDYPKQLDKEILLGFGIPPELVEASTVGSGYSGRAIPAQVFFSMMDEVVSLIVSAIDEQVMKFLVRLNFGKGAGYEIVPDSLAKLVAQTGPGTPGAGAPAGAGAPQPGQGGSGLVPYQGPRGGIGTRDPVTGRVHYGQHPQAPEKGYTRLSLNAHDPDIPDARALWEQSTGPVCAAGAGLTIWRDPKKAPAVETPLNRAVRLSWTPFVGPKGGHGWVSDTGQVRYQREQPGAHEENPDAGPESVLQHPEFAHIPDRRDYGAPGAAQARLAAEQKANADGLDVAELHRRAAAHLQARVSGYAGQWEHMPLGKRLAAHDASARASDTSAESHEAAARDHRAAEAYRRKLAQAGGDAAGWHQDLADHEARAAEQRELRAHETRTAARLHRDHAADIRAGRRQVAPLSHWGLVTGAYQAAHKELAAEKKEREDAQEFAGTYFDHEGAEDRARHYIEQAIGGGLGVEHLDADTRDQIAQDLAELPPEELAAHAAHVFDQHGHTGAGGELYPHAAIAQKAVDEAVHLARRAGRAPKPERFDATGPGDVYVAHREDFNDDQWKGVRAAAQLTPAVGAKFLDPDRALVFRAGTPLAQALYDGGIDGATKPLDDEDAQHALFNGLSSPFQVAQHAVPASAKDYGGTSGSKGSGEFTPEENWNPHHADVYRRVDDDWYMVRPSDGQGAADWYRFVRAKDVPPLSRLPEPYWKNFDSTAEPAHDGDAIERTEVRGAKASKDGAVQKRAIRGPGAREYTKLAAGYVGEHKRTGNLVRSDDALRDRVQDFAADYDFSGGSGMTRDADRDAPTREKLDALEDALQDLRDLDHGHAYDPDAVGDFDSSLLASGESAREDTAKVARDTAAAFAGWERAAHETTRAARDAALKESARFRTEDVGPLLRAVRAAAQAVVGLPGSAIDDDAREHAREIAQRALQVRARARRPVKLSLNGAAG